MWPGKQAPQLKGRLVIRFSYYVILASINSTGPRPNSQYIRCWPIGVDIISPAHHRCLDCDWCQESGGTEIAGLVSYPNWLWWWHFVLSVTSFLPKLLSRSTVATPTLSDSLRHKRTFIFFYASSALYWPNKELSLKQDQKMHRRLKPKAKR